MMSAVSAIIFLALYSNSMPFDLLTSLDNIAQFEGGIVFYLFAIALVVLSLNLAQDFFYY